MRWFLAFFVFTSTYISGQVIPDSTKNGQVKWQYFRPECKLHEKGLFVDGKRHGTWQYRDTTGSVVLREKYKNGIYKWSVYYKNGKIIETRNNKGKIIKRSACGC